MRRTEGPLLQTSSRVSHSLSCQPRFTDRISPTVPLESPAQVRTLLLLAQSRRTVHATLMNERSSRSHSVFTLRISGVNNRTNETCEGSLNLVDLAGSERLNSSGAANDKDRLKETQNINRSLSALGDVIASLGEKATSGGGGGGKEWHVPYRNSKLTYLLQNSLSGNSKTLVSCFCYFCLECLTLTAVRRHRWF
jgi:kinesin family protein C1